MYGSWSNYYKGERWRGKLSNVLGVKGRGQLGCSRVYDDESVNLAKLRVTFLYVCFLYKFSRSLWIRISQKDYFGIHGKDHFNFLLTASQPIPHGFQHHNLMLTLTKLLRLNLSHTPPPRPPRPPRPFTSHTDPFHINHLLTRSKSPNDLDLLTTKHSQSFNLINISTLVKLMHDMKHSSEQISELIVRAFERVKPMGVDQRSTRSIANMMFYLTNVKGLEQLQERLMGYDVGDLVKFGNSQEVMMVVQGVCKAGKGQLLREKAEALLMKVGDLQTNHLLVVWQTLIKFDCSTPELDTKIHSLLLLCPIRTPTDYAYLLYCYSKRKPFHNSIKSKLTKPPRDGLLNISLHDLSLLLYSLANLEQLDFSDEYFKVLELKVQQYTKQAGERVLANFMRGMHKRAGVKVVGGVEERVKEIVGGMVVGKKGEGGVVDSKAISQITLDLLRSGKSTASLLTSITTYLQYCLLPQNQPNSSSSSSLPLLDNISFLRLMYCIALYQQTHPQFHLKLPLKQLISSHVCKNLTKFNAGQALTMLHLQENLVWSKELCRGFRERVAGIKEEECPPEYELKVIKGQRCLVGEKGECRRCYEMDSR